MSHVLEELLYLYVGSSDIERDVAFYRQGLGAELVWRFRAADAEVAALRLGPGPLFLLANHRPAGTVLPIFKCDDLDGAAARLRQKGWGEGGLRVEVPDGPCLVLADPSGNQIALMHQVRPNVLVGSWKDPGNLQAAED